MKRFGLACLFLFTGCGNKPCDTTNQCGSGEACVTGGAAAHCQALSCSDTWFAIDPSDGTCRPLPGCNNKDDVRSWTACDDPCVKLGENACIADPRCQPAYETDPSTTSCGVNTPPLSFPTGNACGGTRIFQSCHANPLRVDPCVNLDNDACKADSRCVMEDVACLCAVTAPDCHCGGCRMKTCSDYTNTDDCNADPECTTTEPIFPPSADTTGAGATTTADFAGCFQKGFGTCLGIDDAMCRRHGECHPVADLSGKFLFCEPDDGLHRCSSDDECGSGERCNNDEACAPPVGSTGDPNFAHPTPANGLGAASVPAAMSCPGLCVPTGCTGHAEKGCVADPSCEPVYALNCSPYGGGDVFNGCSGTLPPQAPNQGDTATFTDACPPCEPTFTQCVDKDDTLVDPEASILNRDPAAIDQPLYQFASVMQRLAGDRDAAMFVDAWLAQIGADVTVNGRVAANRPAAADYFKQLPRLADGRLDLAHLGFQVTSLSNRLDLAGPGDCGEARITYALAGGVTDRRHRMTVIVELRQPDDGARCALTARKWLALSGLHGDGLTLALAQIYGPLLDGDHLNQVRTNEFLVGDTLTNGQQTPWELREWRLVNGALALAPSKQAVDPAATADPAFLQWVTDNSAAIQAQTIKIPDGYLAVTSSENGSRLSLAGAPSPDVLAETALNKMACAGCHTTETNSAFAHVGERFQGTGRAKISDFLRQALPVRAKNLWMVARGRMDQVKRESIKPVH
jgi:hypothetical protein